MSQSYSVFYDKQTGSYLKAKDDQIYAIKPGGEFADNAIAAHPERYEEIGAYPPYRNDFGYIVNNHEKELKEKKVAEERKKILKQPIKKPKNNNDMAYISDKKLYKAVMFARRMIREGTYPGKANKIAANYYEYPVTEVARYVGQAAANIKNRRIQ